MMTFAPRRSAEAALLLALLPGAAAAEPRVSARIDALIPGLFCAPEETGRRAAPDTMSGWIHVPEDPVELVAEGVVAPAVLGLGFGVRFRRAGADLIDIRYEVSHPPMAAAGITRQGWDSLSLGGEWDAIFFQFDEPEELVTGTWAFSAWIGGEELFHVPFTVVEPGQAPELADLCRGGAMLSLLR